MSHPARRGDRTAAQRPLGPDHNIGHGNCFDETELEIVLDAGCTITATNLTEMLNYEQPAMLGRLVNQGATPSLGTDCDPYFNSSMLAVTRHAFLHQRELDNRSLWHEGAWPAKTQHSTLTRDALYWATPDRLERLQQELLASRISIFEQGNYKSVPVERGPQPERFFV